MESVPQVRFDWRRLTAAVVCFGLAAWSVPMMASHGAGPVERLTAALVLVTAIYGWLTSEAVVEMRRAREAAVRPVVIPALEYVEGFAWQGHWGVRNVGPGTAVHVDIVISLSRGIERRLRCPALAPGGARWVSTNDRGTPDLMNLQNLAQGHPHLRLRGTYRDTLDRTHDAAAEFAFADWWEAPPLADTLEASGVEFPEPGDSAGDDPPPAGS